MQAIHCSVQPFSIHSWMIAKLPAKASAKLPSRGQVMVKGTINAHYFELPVEPDGNGGHWLHINKAMQKETGVTEGSAVTLVIEPTKDWPEPNVPADIQKGLVANLETGELWHDITPMARWEWIRWIRATGKSETRKRRIEIARSKMKAGERRPCCWNRNLCTIPEVSKNGVLLEPNK